MSTVLIHIGLAAAATAGEIRPPVDEMRLTDDGDGRTALPSSSQFLQSNNKMKKKKNEGKH